MKCILVFNHLNDIIYTKYNKKFAVHINEFAKSQKLLTQEEINSKLTTAIIVQIFSPIVTSQRIMSCQFGNSYTSIQCQDGINMTFEEYMGFLFVCIGLDDVNTMKRFLNTCVTMVRYLCGPDVMLLKSNTQLAALVTGLLDSWSQMQNYDQAMFVEAVEQLMVNSDLTCVAIQAIQEAVDKLQAVSDGNRIHGLVLVENKFLSLYSTQNAKELSATDILFLTVLNECTNKLKVIQDVDSDSEEEFYSPSSSPVHNSLATNLNEIFQPEINGISSYQILLSGPDYQTRCIPHAIHIKELSPGLSLVILMEVGNPLVSSSLYNTFTNIHTIQTVQMQSDEDTLRPVFDNLDNSIKKLCDALKKTKHGGIEFAYKQLTKQWEFMKKKYLEFMKAHSAEALLRAESSTPGLLDTLKEILSLTCFDQTVLKSSQRHINVIAEGVAEKFLSYNDFLKVKALRNFPLGSRHSLTINKYLEEFPGLVHFLYIDRSNHRVTAPTLDFNSEQTNTLTKKKIWSMINFSRSHLQEGHLSLMWKDTTFNYAYFLWFEDMAGSPVKPTIFPTNASKVLPQPGILCGDFYQKLKEACFPKISPAKIRCYELFCIHLGLATASCVLEHTRRLAATIWELKGHPNNPMDLL